MEKLNRREFVKRIGIASASLGLMKDSENKEDTESIQPDYWELKPDDRVILNCPHSLSDKARLSLRLAMEREFPDNKIIILEDGLKIQFVHQNGA